MLLEEFAFKRSQNQELITETEKQKATLTEKINMKNRLEKEMMLMQKQLADKIDFSEEVELNKNFNRKT